jgi:hypothetical protein
MKDNGMDNNNMDYNPFLKQTMSTHPIPLKLKILYEYPSSK